MRVINCNSAPVTSQSSVNMVCTKLVVFLALLTVCYTENVQVKKCFLPKGTVPTCVVENIRVSPCSEAGENKPCKIKRGDNGTIEFDFTTSFDTSSIQNKAFKAGTVFDSPLVEMDSDGCKFTKCPIEANKKQSYSYSLHINKNYPADIHSVKWMLWQSENPKNKCCFTFSIQILP